MVDINEILCSDPLFKDKENLHAEPINGGLSNESHLVSCENHKYVVKINFAQNEYLRLSRQEELRAQQKAAEMGIAPTVIGSMDGRAYSVSEFLEGRLITRQELEQEKNIIALASIMKRVHSIRGVNRVCSIFDLIEGYVRGIEGFKLKLPEGYHEVLSKVEAIRGRRYRDMGNNKVYCHNDLLSCNILYDGDQMKVIDWELSGMGDPYMDLATVPYEMNYNEEREKLLLATYFGYYEDEMLHNLRDLRYIGLVREMVWALFFAGLNKKSVNHDMDYYGAAIYALDRIKKGFLSIQD